MFKFALVGCGQIAKRYLEIFKEGLSEARLVAVCDVNQDKAESFAKEAGARVFHDVHEMMNHEKLDVVCVLVPSGLHFNVVKELSSYKVPLVVEKPLALRVEQAGEMLKLCQKQGTPLFVVNQNRFHPGVQALKKALVSREVGDPFLVTCRMLWSRDEDYYKKDSWRGSWQWDGGVISNQAAHHVDLMQWLVGPVESVHAIGRKVAAPIEAEDTAVALFKFKNGALGTLSVTTATRPHDVEDSLEILTTNSQFEIKGFGLNRLQQWNSHQLRPDESFFKAPLRGSAHRIYLKDLVRALKNGAEGAVSGEDGVESVRLIHALYESMATNKSVSLDEAGFNASQLGKTK